MIQTKMMAPYIEIISTCNENCVYCYNSDIIKQRDILDFAIIKEIMRCAYANGHTQVTLSGGEPLLHPHIDDIITFAKCLGIKLHVITNATLINSNIAKLLTDNNVDLQLTFDSGIKEIHDLSRGKGTFDKQINALEMLRNEGYSGEINVRSNFWSKNANKDSMHSLLKLCKDYQLQQIDFAIAHSSPKFTSEILESEISTIAKTVKDLSDEFPDIKIKFSEAEISFGCPFVADIEEVGCGTRIAPDGNVYPCQLFSNNEFCIGNVYQSSLLDIVNGKPLQRFLEFMRLRKYFISACIDCIYHTACSGGCPAKAYLDNGTVLSPDGSCIERMKLLNYGYTEMISQINNKTQNSTTV